LERFIANYFGLELTFNLAQILASHGLCYVTNGKEIAVQTFQVLTNPQQKRLRWVYANGAVPSGAIGGGWDLHSAVPLYVGRVDHFSNANVGKILPVGYEQLMYYCWAGKEYSTSVYEVLVEHR